MVTNQYLYITLRDLFKKHFLPILCDIQVVYKELQAVYKDIQTVYKELQGS